MFENLHMVSKNLHQCVHCWGCTSLSQDVAKSYGKITRYIFTGEGVLTMTGFPKNCLFGYFSSYISRNERIARSEGNISIELSNFPIYHLVRHLFRKAWGRILLWFPIRSQIFASVCLQSLAERRVSSSLWSIFLDKLVVTQYEMLKLILAVVLAFELFVLSSVPLDLTIDSPFRKICIRCS